MLAKLWLLYSKGKIQDYRIFPEMVYKHFVNSVKFINLSVNSIPITI